jgi:branched-chain amino acid transport system permease protein
VTSRRVLVAAAIVLALLPFGLPLYALTLAIEALILGLFAMSLDLMVGYTRLFSFGHAAAYGLGAYTAGNLLLHTDIPVVFAVVLAGVFSGIVAIGVGWVCTLATGVSFSMLTLAFAQLLYAVAFKWTSATGASDGLAGIPRTPGPFGVTWFQGKIGFYYLVLACLIAALVFCRSLVASPFGAVLRGIRENEAKTRSLGYNTRRYKIAVVVIAYALGGLAGALYAAFAGFTNTELLFWLLSGQVLIMVIIGGSGTLVGPIIGAIFFLLVQQYLSSYTDSWALFFGLIFIFFVLFIPGGLLGLLTGRRASRAA